MRVKDAGSNLWSIKGVVQAAIPGDDGVARTFTVVTDKGDVLHRNGAWLHHRIAAREERAGNSPDPATNLFPAAVGVGAAAPN